MDNSQNAEIFLSDATARLSEEEAEASTITNLA